MTENAEELERRLSGLKSGLGPACLDLGRALLNGDSAAADLRNRVRQTESDIHDIECMLLALQARPIVSHSEQTEQRADARKRARAGMDAAMDQFEAEAKRLSPAERMARCAEIRPLAKRANRVQEWRGRLAELATRLNDDELRKW